MRFFFKNTFLYRSSRLSKIRSVHTYVMPRTFYFGWICRSKIHLRSKDRFLCCIALRAKTYLAPIVVNELILTVKVTQLWAILDQKHLRTKVLLDACDFLSLFLEFHVAFDSKAIYWSWKQTDNQCKQCLIHIFTSS